MASRTFAFENGTGERGMLGMAGMRSYYNDPLTERIIRCVIDVHRTLGPGFLETIYQRALVVELLKQGLATELEKETIVLYDGHEVGRHRLDLVVEEKVLIELKAVDALTGAHYSQVRSYLKATGLKIALLINFAADRADIRRVGPR